MIEVFDTTDLLAPFLSCLVNVHIKVGIFLKVDSLTAKIALDPEMKAKFAQLGLDVAHDPPDALAAIIKSDIAKWAKVIKSANIKAGD